jgi:hypothetical protein
VSAEEAAATAFFVIAICEYSFNVGNFQINLFMIYTLCSFLPVQLA